MQDLKTFEPREEEFTTLISESDEEYSDEVVIVISESDEESSDEEYNENYEDYYEHHRKKIENLIAQGITRDTRGNSLLFLVINMYIEIQNKGYPRLERGFLEIVKELLNLGININATDKFGNKPLFYAISRNASKAMIRLLVELGADINQKNSYRNTPLQHAISIGSSEAIIRLLLELGADINAKNDLGTTPLELVISKHQENALKLFIEHNAQITSQHINASLWKAIKKTNSEAHIHWLLKVGADVHIEDDQAETCLHVAAKKVQRWKYIEPLLQAGAKVYIRNNEDQTPLHQLITAMEEVFRKRPNDIPTIKETFTVILRSFLERGAQWEPDFDKRLALCLEEVEALKTWRSKRFKAMIKEEGLLRNIPGAIISDEVFSYYLCIKREYSEWIAKRKLELEKEYSTRPYLFAQKLPKELQESIIQEAITQQIMEWAEWEGLISVKPEHQAIFQALLDKLFARIVLAKKQEMEAQVTSAIPFRPK